MTRDAMKSAGGSDRSYRPLQEGYTPDTKGYTANVNGSNPLPKAPTGGTGQTSGPTSKEAGTKEQGR